MLRSIRLGSTRSKRFKQFYSCLATYPHLGQLVKRFDAGANRIAGLAFLRHLHLLPALEHVDRADWGPEKPMMNADQTDCRRPAPYSLWIFKSIEDPAMPAELPAWERLSTWFDLCNLRRFEFTGSALHFLVQNLLSEIPREVRSIAIRDFQMDDAAAVMKVLGERPEISSLDLLPREASVRKPTLSQGAFSPLVVLPNLRRLAICDRSLDGLFDRPHQRLETLIIGIPPGDLYGASDDSDAGSNFDESSSNSSMNDVDSAATSTEDDDDDDSDADNGEEPIPGGGDGELLATRRKDLLEALRREDLDEGTETRTQRAGFPGSHPIYQMVQALCRIRHADRQRFPALKRLGLQVEYTKTLSFLTAGRRALPGVREMAEMLSDVGIILLDSQERPWRPEWFTEASIGLARP